MKITNDAHNVPAASISSTPPLICPMKISDMRKIICVNTVEKNCEKDKEEGAGGKIREEGSVSEKCPSFKAGEKLDHSQWGSLASARR